MIKSESCRSSKEVSQKQYFIIALLMITFVFTPIYKTMNYNSPLNHFVVAISMPQVVGPGNFVYVPVNGLVVLKSLTKPINASQSHSHTHFLNFEAVLFKKTNYVT